VKRRSFIAAVTGSLLARPRAGKAQERAKAARIGYLATGRVSPAEGLDFLLQGLRDLGYTEGRSLLIEYRDAEGKIERLPALAAQLVALKVDVIVAAAGTLPALAAQRATSSIPVLFIGVGDPVTSGLVTSLARPGGNATGTSVLATELVGKWLELLTQAVPEARRVAILWQPGGLSETTDKEVLKEAAAAARMLGVHIQPVEARRPADFERAFAEMTRASMDALVVLSTSMFAGAPRRLADLAAKNRLPTAFPFRLYVDAGGLMSYGANLADLFRRTATYLDKILKGAKPGDLPVEQPSKFDLVINLKTAKALRLTIPPSLLLRADQVIE
jgi:putative ABC transport system substrate-binding protein